MSSFFSDSHTSLLQITLVLYIIQVLLLFFYGSPFRVNFFFSIRPLILLTIYLNFLLYLLAQ